MIGEPLSIGMPATQTLSLTPTRLPASGPSAAPGIEHTHDHPFDGFSAPVGRWPRSARGYFTGRCSSGSSSSRRKPARVAGAAAANVSSSSSVRSKRNCSRAMRWSSWRDGGWTGTDDLLRLWGTVARPYSGRRARARRASAGPALLLRLVLRDAAGHRAGVLRPLAELRVERPRAHLPLQRRAGLACAGVMGLGRERGGRRGGERHGGDHPRGPPPAWN